MDEVNQHIDDNAKAAYVDWIRNDGPQPGESILDHVEACGICKRDILELAEILDKVDQVEKNEKSRNINLSIVLRAVAVLAGILAVAMLIQFLRPEKDSVEMAGLEQDSSQIINPTAELEKDTVLHQIPSENEVIEPEVIEVLQHDTIKYAANYVQNPGLEALVDARFRSETKNDLKRKLIPEQLSKGETLNLELSNMDGSDIEFVLISNSGENLKTFFPHESIVTIKLNFEPGLYYWKIISSDEIILVGKFRLYNNKP